MIGLTDPLPCNSDPDLFFSNLEKNVRKAKALCAGCPEKVECLERCLEYEALGNQAMAGIHGGLTVKERNRLRKRR